MIVESRTCRAPDGVTLAYSAAGAGDPALVFVHGDLADRTFFDSTLCAFAHRHRSIALDLPGHGDSGANRTAWGIPEFGADVRAVADAESLGRLVVLGNSLGGPVAVEAALRLEGRALGVVGIDTFHRLDHTITADEARDRADAFATDPEGMVREMVRMLFHVDADPAIVADALGRMGRTPAEAGRAMFLGMAGYDQAAAVRRLALPLRAINGDLFPTDVAAARQVYPDFDALVLPHTGHYPMLECPEAFHRAVERVLAEIAGRSSRI
jgi:pimeloyl-ACP methyl ester carboxylesterase